MDGWLQKKKKKKKRRRDFRDGGGGGGDTDRQTDRQIEQEEGIEQVVWSVASIYVDGCIYVSLILLCACMDE